MSAVPGERTCLYDDAGVARLLDRMAQQAAPVLRGADRVALIGVLRRGAPLADQLAERLVRDHGLAAPLRLDLRVQRYADDLTLLHPDTPLTEPLPQTMPDLTGWTLMVVDDVLYTGHSLAQVLAFLVRRRPAAVRVAVLADRCAATLPIAADVVGARLQIPPDAVVECHVPPYESDSRIELLWPRRAA